MDVEWFKSRKTDLGIKDQALAEALGVERSVANKVINGRVGFRASRASEVAQLFRVSVEEILYRAGISSTPPARSDHAPTVSASADDDTVEIMQLDLSFSMGPGTSVDDYIEEAPLRFDLGYVRSFTRAPTHMLRLGKGVGDSMYPTLLSSDLVWIDTTQRTLNQQDRIWAISLYGAAAIKRLRAIGNRKILVISDNEQVENQEVEEDDIRIAGRICRFERDL